VAIRSIAADQRNSRCGSREFEQGQTMSLYKRKKSSYYWCRFTVRGEEIRRSTGTAIKDDAEEFETNLRSHYWRQAKLGQSFHTFRQAAERWLEETDKATKDKDEQRLEWWNHFIGDLPLREINADVLAAARKRLAERKVKNTERTLSKTTINHYMQVVRGILRKAKDEWEWLDSVPKVPMHTLKKKDPRWITRDQFHHLLTFLPDHTRDLVHFAVATGKRKANITHLRWDRVDLKRKTAYIPSNEAKASEGIPIALNKDAVAILKRRQGIDETYCFTYQGHPVKDVATAAWRKAVKAAGFPGLRYHDMRHTWASWQVQSETPLQVVKEMGNWKSFEMVLRYAHLSPGHLRQYADRTLVGTPKKRGRPKRAQVPVFGGEGRDRTADLGVMKSKDVKKIA
jgi:integrase